MGEWTIEVMKKARTEIFEPEVRKTARMCSAIIVTD